LEKKVEKKNPGNLKAPPHKKFTLPTEENPLPKKKAKEIVLITKKRKHWTKGQVQKK